MQQVRGSPRHLSTPAQRDLAGLMGLYEENYIRLRTLFPAGFERVPPCVVSRVTGCVDIHVEILERARYTTTINMTCLFEAAEGRARREPDLTIRVCHDARTAEVLRSPRCDLAPSHDARRTLALCWQRNRFLHKWLGYCLRRGHRFGSRQRPAGRSPEAASTT